MTGPVTDPPPSGPGKDDRPLDPNSPKGREVAERLTRVLGELEVELAQAGAADRERQVRAA